MDQVKLATVREAAEALGVSERHLWGLLATGKLEKVRIGRCVRIPVRAIEQFILNGGTDGD